jgi:class 3 adenylate cyclase
VSAEQSALRFEIGHVLFIDIIGYSKLLLDEQRELQEQLNQIVRQAKAFRAAEGENKLVRLPTGDGMALVFFTNAEAPVRCAVDIAEASQSSSQMRLRIGINTGPVSGVADVNNRSNVAGAGINIAQRVMDLGDAGHILLSKRAAEDLMHFRDWQPHLHELGEVEVKHGVKVSVVNLYTDKLGNPELPAKLKLATRKERARRTGKRILIAAGIALTLAIAGVLSIFLRSPPPRNQEAAPLVPEKSIAVLPLENLSDEKENAYFADGVQDELLSNLAKIKNLKVISRTSVMQY